MLNSNSICIDGTKSPFGIKGVGKLKAAVVSDEGDLLSYSNGNNAAAKRTFIDNKPVEIKLQPGAIAFGTLVADTAPISSGFPIDDDEFDLDRPTEGFSSIPEAIEDIRQGKVFVFPCRNSWQHFQPLLHDYFKIFLIASLLITFFISDGSGCR